MNKKFSDAISIVAYLFMLYILASENLENKKHFDYVKSPAFVEEVARVEARLQTSEVEVVATRKKLDAIASKEIIAHDKAVAEQLKANVVLKQMKKYEDDNSGHRSMVNFILLSSLCLVFVLITIKTIRNFGRSEPLSQQVLED